MLFAATEESEANQRHAYQGQSGRLRNGVTQVLPADIHVNIVNIGLVRSLILAQQSDGKRDKVSVRIGSELGIPDDQILRSGIATRVAIEVPRISVTVDDIPIVVELASVQLIVHIPTATVYQLVWVWVSPA